jgi:putative MATE family efflux protein
MKDKNKAVLINGSIGMTLVRLTLPMMVGMIGMVIFNLVDAYFIGKLGTNELAAMGFTLPIVMLQGSISMGLGVGASSVISKLIGEGDYQKVKRTTTDSLLLSVLIVIIFVIAGVLTIEPLFSLLGAKGQVLALTKKYMTVWYWGVAFVVIPMIGNNAIRAAGNTVIPTVIMSIAVLINCILDPLLIFGIGPFPEMGMTGAALATVIARAITFIFALYFLHYKFGMLTMQIPKLKELFSSWKAILYVGIPAALTMIISPLAMGFITKLAAGFGEETVAALGIGNRVEMFALSPLMALSSVLIPFIGQNLGAKKVGRIKRGVFLSQKFSFLVGLVMLLFFITFRIWVGSFFSENEKVIKIFAQYILIVSSGYGFLGAFFINNSVFNAIKQPIMSTSLNIFRMCFLYIPLAWALSRIFQLNGIFFGALISSVISGFFSISLVRSNLNKLMVTV